MKFGLAMERWLVATVAIASMLTACTPPSNTTPPAVPSASPEAGITRDEAIAAARAAAPRYATAEVLSAESGPFGELARDFISANMSPAPDQLVWRVRLGSQPSPTGGQGTDVILDFWNGRVIVAGDWVS